MKVITATESWEGDLYNDQGKPLVFLAGGITNCPWWQDEIIGLLEPYDSGVLLNPRRRNFPICDPDASREQIEWEFKAIADSNIFSMWFSAGESVQPICMYELGRNLTQFPRGQIVVGVEPGYKREQDVRIQVELADHYVAERIGTTIEAHAYHILRAIELYGK